MEAPWEESPFFELWRCSLEERGEREGRARIASFFSILVPVKETSTASRELSCLLLPVSFSSYSSYSSSLGIFFTHSLLLLQTHYTSRRLLTQIEAEDIIGI